jgi:hypothetical protein
LDSGKLIGLSYPGGVKGEKELEGKAAFAGWDSLPSIFRGVFALYSFGFFHPSSIKTKSYRGL